MRILLIFLLLTACSTIDYENPGEFEIGEPILAPSGCVEARQRDPDFDC